MNAGRRGLEADGKRSVVCVERDIPGRDALGRRTARKAGLRAVSKWKWHGRGGRLWAGGGRLRTLNVAMNFLNEEDIGLRGDATCVLPRG